MALTDGHQNTIKPTRHCPGCGRLATDKPYCPECGSAIEAPTSASAATSEQPRTISSRPPDTAPLAGVGSRSRLVLVALAVALGLAAAAAAAIVILLSGSGSDQGSVYRQKLSSALAPVVAANRTLSTALQSVDGSQTTITTAQNATSQAQSAVIAAHGAVTVLTVPRSDSTLSQQAQQALVQENGYMQAVSSTLSNPVGQSASQLRTLATGTQSALVPLDSVAPGASSSLTGTDNLLSWVAGANATAQRQNAAAQSNAIQQAAASGSHTTVVQVPETSNQPTSNPPAGGGYVTPSGGAVPGSWSPGAAAYASGVGTPYSWTGGQDCDQNIFAGGSTSCSFANNIFEVVAAASHYANVIPGSITAYDPGSNTTDTLTCTQYWGNDNQDDLQCITADGVGTAFPVWAANAYYN